MVLQTTASWIGLLLLIRSHLHLSSNVEVCDDLIYTLFVPLIKCVAEAVLSEWLDFLVNLSSDSFLHIVQR